MSIILKINQIDIKAPNLIRKSLIAFAFKLGNDS
jgi:hypothetical protein